MRVPVKTKGTPPVYPGSAAYPECVQGTAWNPCVCGYNTVHITSVWDPAREGAGRMPHPKFASSARELAGLWTVISQSESISDGHKFVCSFSLLTSTDQSLAPPYATGAPVAKYKSQVYVFTTTRPLFLERHESHECGG